MFQVAILNGFDVQCIFIAVEIGQASDRLHTAFSGQGQGFVERNRIVQKFIKYFSKIFNCL